MPTAAQAVNAVIPQAMFTHHEMPEFLVLSEVLSCDEPDTVGKVVDLLKEESFITRKHRLLFAAIRDTFTEGRAVSYEQVALTLSRAGHIKTVSGLVEFFRDVPRISNLSETIELVEKHATLRRYLDMADQIRSGIESMTLTDPQDVSKIILKEAFGKEDRSRSGTRISQVVEEAGGPEKFINPNDRERILFPEYWPRLRKNTLNLMEGHFILLGGLSSTGKTSFARHLTRDVVFSQKKRVLWGSLEMTREEMYFNFACEIAGVSAFRAQKGLVTPDQKMRIAEALDHMYQFEDLLEIDSNLETVEAQSAALRMRAAEGRPVDLFICDHIGLMQSVGRVIDERQTLLQVSNGMKRLTMKHKIPFLVLSQLNESYKTARKDSGGKNKNENFSSDDQKPAELPIPTMDDFNGSKNLSRVANLAMILQGKDPLNQMQREDGVREVDLYIVKQRGGVLGKIDYEFNAPFGVFNELAPAGHSRHCA